MQNLWCCNVYCSITLTSACERANLGNFFYWIRDFRPFLSFLILLTGWMQMPYIMVTFYTLNFRLFSPGLIQLRKGLRGSYKWGEGGWYNRTKQERFKINCSYFGTERPFLSYDRRKWVLPLNFNHWGWTFCLLQQFTDFLQTLVLFLLYELVYAVFFPLPY